MGGAGSKARLLHRPQHRHRAEALNEGLEAAELKHRSVKLVGRKVRLEAGAVPRRSIGFDR